MTHIAYVAAAYCISAIAIGALVTWILRDQTSQMRALRDLEERGIRRRSAGAEPSE